MGVKDKLKKATEAVDKGSKIVADKAKVAGKAIGSGSVAAVNKAKSAGKAIGTGSKTAVTKTRAVVDTTHEALVKAIDQDGNGMIDSTDLIIIALKVPGVKVNREVFLRKELARHCSQEMIDCAVRETPAIAGIDPALIDKLVDETIKFERNAVSGISAVLGMPGGAAMVATIPADIAQYYGYMLRAAQKMMYFYGFPELDITGDGVNINTETINSLTVCLGIMYGVANANIAIKAMAKAFATGVEKQLMRKALTKGTIYPIVKSIAKWFGKRMTKEIFAGFFKKAIPVVGGIVGGGLTYATFKPCCNRLKKTLCNTSLSNLQYETTEEEEKVFEAIRDDKVVDVWPEELTEVNTTDTEEE